MRVNKGDCKACGNDTLEIVECESGDQAVECQTCKVKGPESFSSNGAISSAIKAEIL